MTPILLLTTLTLDKIVFALMAFVLSGLGWYARKIDQRIDRTESSKVDKESFDELKREMRRGFDGLGKELHKYNSEQTDTKLALAVLSEKMTRIEVHLEHAKNYQCPYLRGNDGNPKS